jgi:hypothetical protein
VCEGPLLHLEDTLVLGPLLGQRVVPAEGGIHTADCTIPVQVDILKFKSKNLLSELF